MSRTYHVKTDRFGVISIIADNIAEARKRAKGAYGVGPRAVSAAPAAHETCPGCDSSPCICEAS